MLVERTERRYVHPDVITAAAGRSNLFGRSSGGGRQPMAQVVGTKRRTAYYASLSPPRVTMGG
jgi:hypothetical protein